MKSIKVTISLTMTISILLLVSGCLSLNSEHGSLNANLHKASTTSEIQSANVLEFGPNNVLFVGDSYSGKIVAYEVENTVNAMQGKAYNLNGFDSQIESLLGIESDEMLIKDLAVHPVSNEAYLAVSYIAGESYKPAIIIADQSGEVRLMNLAGKNTQIYIDKAPAEDFEFYDNFQARNLTFTDMDYHQGKLYISGLSNQDFSSTLRIADYPFNGRASISSVEIFHAMHGQNETRAPIRTLSVINIDGKDHLLAAYTCTPLVTIPIDQLHDGAHVRGKTIGDVGYGNTPIDMLNFTGQDMQKNNFEVVLLTNKNQAANVLLLAGIAEANKGEGLTTFQGFGSFGFEGYKAPLGGISHVAEQDGYHILSIRRDQDSGDLQLVSFLKNLYMRISDFQSEYEMPGYEYAEDQKWVRDLQDMMKVDEGYSTN